MKELFDSLPEKKVDFLLDTCFFIWCFNKGHVKHLEKFCKENFVGMSTFNIEEFMHMHHKLAGQENHHIRSFLKRGWLFKVPVNVVPGDKLAEKKYVNEFDPTILQICPDPSDAILFVLGIKMEASILTRDKHHIFTAAAENYINKYYIKIYNEFPL